MQVQDRLGTPPGTTARGAERPVWTVWGERWSRAVGQGDTVLHSPSPLGLSPGTDATASTAKPETFAGQVVSEDNGKDQKKPRKGL